MQKEKYATVFYYLSCNQYISCTNMLYEYIFALFVLDEYAFRTIRINFSAYE
jgi:hypothetical protein